VTSLIFALRNALRLMLIVTNIFSIYYFILEHCRHWNGTAGWGNGGRRFKMRIGWQEGWI